MFTNTSNADIYRHRFAAFYATDNFLGYHLRNIASRIGLNGSDAECFCVCSTTGGFLNPNDIAACRALAEQFIIIRGGGQIVGQLGDGGSAVVFKWEQAGVSRALKVYDPKFFASGAAPAERHRLDLQRRLIDHHCPSLVDTLNVDELLSTCFVTMQFFDGEQLKKVIGEVPDEAIAPLITQVVEAVRFLESFGLVHRDIKPENILVSSDFSRLCLLDLGVAREISGDEDRVDGTDHGEKRPFVATAQYSSPEYLFRLEAPSPALWKALTLYQVGGVLHDMVCKKALFAKAVAANNKYALAMAVMREPPDFNGTSARVSDWAALAARCLTKDGRLRMQLVDWPDFVERPESAKDRLRRSLAARAANVDRAAFSEDRAHNLHWMRKKRLAELVEALRSHLINEFSPQLRVRELGGNDSRACLLLRLEEDKLGVKLAVECSWQAGIHENSAAVFLAAIAAIEQEQTEFSGTRRSIGELDVDGLNQPQILSTLIEAASDVLVKYVELADTNGITDGADLVPLTWPN